MANASELESFRREWVHDIRSRRHAPVPAAAVPVPPPPPSSEAPAVRPESPPLPASQLEELSLEDRSEEQDERKLSPVEIYELAVISEREGRLNDALTHYRRAFRLDPDVDKAYRHHLERAATSAAPPPPDDDESGFAFQRTIQLGPDYVNKPGEHRSTKAFLDSLVVSFAEHPFRRSSGHKDVPDDSADDVLESDHFHADVVDAGSAFSRLPPEILMLILRHLSLSPVIAPPPPPPPPAALLALAEGAVKPGRHRPRRLTPREERYKMELEIMAPGPLGHAGTARTDVEALERFGRVCRAARIATMDEGIWRRLCERVYVPPQPVPSASVMADYRRCFIEQPRLRTDGVYIAVVTYLRRGDSGQAWYTPTHVITFYRYLRYYPSGLVLSLLTTEAPSTTVRDFNPTLRMKGMTRGRWRMRADGVVDMWSLEDPTVKESDRKYAFRMRCALRSTARGRMNKLEMISLATERKTTQEIEDVPIRPTKPFYFSKVTNYAGADE